MDAGSYCWNSFQLQCITHENDEKFKCLSFCLECLLVFRCSFMDARNDPVGGGGPCLLAMKISRRFKLGQLEKIGANNFGSVGVPRRQLTCS